MATPSQTAVLVSHISEVTPPPSAKTIIVPTAQMEKSTAVPLLIMWFTTFIAIVNLSFWRMLGGEPAVISWWFDGFSLTCRKIREYRTTSLALDYLYTKRIEGNETPLGRWLIRWWLQTRNAQAVRNRLRITIEQIQNAISESGKREIVILSIASGSAEAVLQAAQWAHDHGIKVQMYLLDRDGAALERARARAQQLGISHCLVQCFQRDVRALESIAHMIPQPDIIEMVGFLDYRPYDKAVSLLHKLYGILPRGGRLITAQICPNFEQYFVHYVLGWWMIYRSPQQFHKLLLEAKFGHDAITLLMEPWRIHCVAVAYK